MPDCAYRFGRSGDTWQLGNMIPLISVYENGDWRRDPYWPVGDPFYTACANFAVRIKAPEEYTVLGSMPLKRDGDMLTGRVNGIRDIAFVIKREAVTVRRVSGGVELAAAADTRAEAEKMLKYAENALKVFSNLYGAYPYESFTAVKCGLTSKSTAYPCLVMIDDGCFVNDTVQEQEIARQCAHQWFYGIVGSDPFYQPWQDEGCAEFAVLSYWSERYGRDAGEELRLVWTEEAMKERILSSVTPGSPLDRFADLTEYTAVVYDRGAAFFAACDLMCGGRMNAFLREYCMKCAYENVSRERFNALLNEFAGLDMTPLMLDYLDTLI